MTTICCCGAGVGATGCCRGGCCKGGWGGDGFGSGGGGCGGGETDCSCSDALTGCLRRSPYLAYSMSLRAATLPSCRSRSSLRRLGHTDEARILCMPSPLELANSSALLHAAFAVVWSSDCLHHSACCHHSSTLDGQWPQPQSPLPSQTVPGAYLGGGRSSMLARRASAARRPASIPASSKSFATKAPMLGSRPTTPGPGSGSGDPGPLRVCMGTGDIGAAGRARCTALESGDSEGRTSLRATRGGGEDGGGSGGGR